MIKFVTFIIGLSASCILFLSMYFGLKYLKEGNNGYLVLAIGGFSIGTIFFLLHSIRKDEEEL